MNDNEKTRISLLMKKSDLLSEVLNITKNTTFVGDENDPVRYVELLEKRDVLFKKIYSIDEKIAEDESVFGKDAEAVVKRIKATISGIIKLDKENEPFVKKAVDFLKGNIKGINVGKSLSNGYHQYSSANVGKYFDTQN